MKTYGSIVFSIVLLVCAAVGTLYWSRMFYGSIQTYQSPLAQTSFTNQPPSVSKTARVVVVLVSGLSEATLDQYLLPNFTQISQTGASAIIQGMPPTYSHTSKMTVVAGAPAETNGAPPLDVPAEQLLLLNSDTIFARAHAAGLSVALVGPEEWRRFVPRNHVDQLFLVNATGPETDQLVFENALLILQNDNVDLLFVNFTQLAFAAQYQGGTAGAAYQQAVNQIDDYLGQLYQAVDAGSQVLVILGDHGFTAAGGSGGAEPELTRRPITLIGESVVPGSYSDFSPHDVAPTVTTILGAAPPALAQGRILFEILRLDETNQTLAQLALTHQRIELLHAYQTAISGQPVGTELEAELEQARLALAQKNSSGAFQLARLAEKTADSHLAAVRHQYISAEQWPRLAGALLLFLVISTILWRRRGKYFAVILFAVVITVGLYHILYRLQGFEYSLSTITNFADWPFSIGRRVTVSLLAGGGFLLIVLMLASEEKWAAVLGASLGFGVLVTFVFSVPLFWAFWQHGLVATWYLPSVDVAFWQINALYETMISALLGLLLPWPITLLILFVGLVRRSLDKSQPQARPDAVPGLRL